MERPESNIAREKEEPKRSIKFAYDKKAEKWSAWLNIDGGRISIETDPGMPMNDAVEKLLRELDDRGLPGEWNDYLIEQSPDSDLL